MIFKIVEIISVAEQKIREGKPGARDTGQGSEACLASHAKIKSAAGDIRLRVVITPHFELEPNVDLVMPTQHGHAGR